MRNGLIWTRHGFIWTESPGRVPPNIARAPTAVPYSALEPSRITRPPAGESDSVIQKMRKLSTRLDVGPSFSRFPPAGSGGAGVALLVVGWVLRVRRGEAVERPSRSRIGSRRGSSTSSSSSSSSSSCSSSSSSSASSSSSSSAFVFSLLLQRPRARRKPAPRKVLSRWPSPPI